MIYFDNGATTLKKPPAVAKQMTAALEAVGNPGRGAHGYALAGSRLIYDAREAFADFFGVESPKQVVFTSGATDSLNIVIQGLFEPGNHVITSCMEHNSVLRPLYRLKEQGLELTIAGVREDGCLDYEALRAAVKENTKAMVLTHASNVTGNLTDLKAVGGLCREKGLLLIVDAAQTAGIMPINMAAANIDILCFTGHKGLLGPQGTGGICIREGIRIRPWRVGGTGIHTYDRTQPAHLPDCLEAGTPNTHGIAGLLGALRYIQEQGTDTIFKQEQKLTMMFYEGIRKLEGIRLYGNFQTAARAPVISFNIRDMDSAQVSHRLFQEYGICSRPGAHCAPLMHQALGTIDQGCVRFSFSHYNDEGEILQAIEALKEFTNEE